MTKRLVLLALITACAGKSGTGAAPPTPATDSAAMPAPATPAPATDASAAKSFATVTELTAAFTADPALAGTVVDVKGKMGHLTQQGIGGAVYWDVMVTDDASKPGGSVWCRIKDADKDAAKAAGTAGIVARGKLGTVKKGALSSTMLDECSITAAP